MNKAFTPAFTFAEKQAMFVGDHFPSHLKTDEERKKWVGSLTERERRNRAFEIDEWWKIVNSMSLDAWIKIRMPGFEAQFADEITTKAIELEGSFR